MESLKLCFIGKSRLQVTWLPIPWHTLGTQHHRWTASEILTIRLGQQDHIPVAINLWAMTTLRIEQPLLQGSPKAI